MLRKDDTFKLYVQGVYKYGTIFLDEINPREDPILEQTGLYPKNKQKMLDGIIALRLDFDCLLIGRYLDKRDIEFLRDKVHVQTLQHIVAYTSLDINYIKHLIRTGLSINVFHLSRIIRRTYKDLYEVFGDRDVSLFYVSPKNNEERKYFEILDNNGRFQIWPRFLYTEVSIPNIILKYIHFKN
jgi:hypothetical protein